MRWLTNNISKQAISEHQASVAALVAANGLPLLGVLLFGWSTFEIVVLYWFENVVLGVINILKMISCSPDAEQIDLASLLKEKVDVKTRRVVEEAGPLGTNRWVSQGAKFFFIPFFTVHYGIFCLVHGVFVFVLLGGGGPFGGGNGLQGEFLSLNLILVALALIASHLISFCVNYLGRGEYRRTVLPILMMQPYGRIVVLHLAILFGAFAVIMLGSPVWMLVLMILGKTVLDLNLHLQEHRANAKSPTKEPILTTV